MSNESLMREYETIYVLKPELDDKSATEFMLKMKDLVSSKGGKNIQVTCMGRRKLAWMRDKHTKGTFVNHKYLGVPGLTKELERLLGIDESVMLRQTILLEKDVVAADKPEMPDILEIKVIRDRREQASMYDENSEMEARYGRGSYERPSVPASANNEAGA